MKRTLFLKALLDGSVCRGFTVAASNIICEGFGVAFDLVERNNLTGGNVEWWQHDLVKPWEIVRFALMNTDFDADPPIVVSCDYDRLLAPYGDSNSSFLKEFCRLEKVSDFQLSHTSGKHVCSVCYPSKTQRAVFVTKSRDRPRLYCQFHAVRRFQTGADLLIYCPFLVKVHKKEDRFWLSTLYWPYAFTSEDESSSGGGWYPLACTRSGNNLDLGDSNTTNVVKWLQYLCRNLTSSCM